MFAMVLTILSFTLGIGIMIEGWGIEPHSWGWIIAGGVLNIVISAAAANLTTSK